MFLTLAVVVKSAFNFGRFGDSPEVTWEKKAFLFNFGLEENTPKHYESLKKYNDFIICKKIALQFSSSNLILKDTFQADNLYERCGDIVNTNFCFYYSSQSQNSGR